MAAKSLLFPGGESVLFKANFDIDVEDKLDSFYSGGDIAFSEDGRHLFCSCVSSFAVVDVQSGRTVAVLEEEEDTLGSLCVSKDGKLLMTGWRSSLIRQYNWEEKTCTRQWKAHNAHVVTMDIDSTSTLLASGASDGTIKVWDCYKQYCTHNFKGSGGVVSFVRFHPNTELYLLLSASMDCNIRMWDLKTSRCKRVLTGHVSAVTDVSFAISGNYFASCGRDQVLLLWDLDGTQPKRTVTTFESNEGLVTLPEGIAVPTSEGPPVTTSSSGFHVCTAGEKGIIRIWDMLKGECVHSITPQTANTDTPESSTAEGMDEDNPNAFMGLRLQPSLNVLVAVTAEHNIVMFSLSDFSLTKQLIGNNDEILDIALVGEQEEYIAMATNSSLVKVFNRRSFGCHLLHGHTAVVLCLDCTLDGRVMVTGSKDNTLRVWKLNERGQFVCVAVGIGHTHTVGAVAVSKQKTSFIVSGSTDRTVKMWSLKALKHKTDEEAAIHLPVKFTQIAHDKDINSIDVSPNDKLVVTGSQDKTAKLWSTADGGHCGTMRGHRRGLWCVKFSPVDQCVATSSADSTIKLWAVADCSCVKTFEGHSNSVLKVLFCTRGMQLVSSGGDGLIKVWTIKNNECTATLDSHEDKVWCLAMSREDTTLISGGADSRMCVWKDVTEQVQEELRLKREETVLKEQELFNLLDQDQYTEAVGLAISLNQPLRVFNILHKMLEDAGPDGSFKSTICSLRQDQIISMLNFVNKWNMNSKFSEVAQAVLKVVFSTHSVEDLLAIPNIKEIVEGLIPYTERHLRRLSKLQQLASFVEYTWDCMKIPSIEDQNTQTTGTSSSTLQFTSISKSTPILTNRDTSEEQMDQSTADQPGEDGDSDGSVEPPVCAPADSTTPDATHLALWVEDRTPNKTTVIEDDDQEYSDSKRKKEEDRHEALFKKYKAKKKKRSSSGRLLFQTPIARKTRITKRKSLTRTV